MIDDLCEHLSTRMTSEEWIDMSELYMLMKNQSLKPAEVEDVMGFLKKYFLEIDEIGQKARLNPWMHNLFKIPTR